MGIIGKLFGRSDKGPANGQPADAGVKKGYLDEGDLGEAPQPEKISLANGEPLYWALAEISPAGVLSEGDEAKNLLARAESLNPDAVKSCQGKTRDQAAAILRGILDAANGGRAAA